MVSGWGKYICLLIVLILSYCKDSDSALLIQTTDEHFSQGVSSNVVVTNESISLRPGIVKKNKAILPTPRESMSGVYYPPDGKIYIFGGHYYSTKTGYYYSDIIEYNPVSDEIIKKAESLPEARFGSSAV